MVSESKMREILFRGKRTKTGEWVYGLLWHYNDKAAAIYSDKLDRLCWVVPETVGQYTGLTDKNGKRIFEGNIICYITPDGIKATGVVRFGEYGTGGTIGIGFYVEWVDRDGAGWLRQDIGFWAKYRDVEVIGNIHDNPELLEVSNA